MSRKYLRALWVAMLHVAVLVAAHNAAEFVADLGHEAFALIRDELAVDAVMAVWH
jgi:hypothetical protein